MQLTQLNATGTLTKLLVFINAKEIVVMFSKNADNQKILEMHDHKIFNYEVSYFVTYGEEILCEDEKNLS